MRTTPTPMRSFEIDAEAELTGEFAIVRNMKTNFGSGCSGRSAWGIGGRKLKSVADVDRHLMDLSHSHIDNFWGGAVPTPNRADGPRVVA